VRMLPKVISGIEKVGLGDVGFRVVRRTAQTHSMTYAVPLDAMNLHLELEE